MSTRIKKMSVIGLSACLALTSLAGCSKKDEFDATAVALTVNGDEIPVGLVKFATHYSQAWVESMYASYLGVSDVMNQDLYGDGTTLGDSQRDYSVTELKQMVLAEQKMEEYSVEVTEEEKAAITEAAAEFIAANEEEVLEKMCADQETVERYLELNVIQTKMETAMSADVDTEVSDEEAAQRRIQYTMFTPSTETETEAATEAESETGTESSTEAESGTEGETAVETEAETAVETEAETAVETEAETAVLTEETSTLTQAADETEEVTEAAETETETAGETEAGTEAEDSTEAGSEVSTEASSEAETETETETETEDPAMVEARAEAKAEAQALLDKLLAGEDFETAAEEVGKAANEMTFGVGDEETRAELLAATDDLEDGDLVQEVVETDSGYYVVKLISKLDREATDAEKESIVEERKSERIEELYTEWEDASEISQDDDVLATIVFDFSLEQYVETETETEAVTESGSEAESETGTETTTEAGTEAATEAVTEAVTEAGTEAGTEKVTETETESETESETETETEAVTE